MKKKKKRILLMSENVILIRLLHSVVYTTLRLKVKVKSSIPELGIGIFCEIDETSGHYVYQFHNGRLYEF